MFSLLADLISFQLEAEELHAARARALLDAEETAKLRERFIGILGHDLRNPLNAITMAAQILLTRDDVPEASVGLVRRITRSATRIENMVSDLLDFARGRLGGFMPIDRKACDAVAIVRQVTEELEMAYPGRQLELTTPPLLTVQWDRERVAQMLSNLIANALQHSPPASPVYVTLDGSTPLVALTVRNGGAAIPPETLRLIFDPFRQGAATHRPAGQGLGLGLYIAREIVMAHGGTIDVSTSDEGTTFTVRMPS